MEQLTFEQAIARIEQIVKALEDENTPIDESLVLFQEGIQLTSYCNTKLENIEDKVARVVIGDKIQDIQLED